MSGGPKTPIGKKRSRENSLKHGLSAETLLGDILGRERIDQAYQQFQAEWQPGSPTEEILIREMSRHKEALARIEKMEDAVLRRGAQAAWELELDSVAGVRLVDNLDIALAGAGTSEALDRISRYRRAHERGFYRGLAGLKSLREALQTYQGRSDSPAISSIPKTEPINPFQEEQDCEDYLLSRHRSGAVPCAKCGERAGRFIPSRKTWQCHACRRQTSLRAGTVMAGSHVGLLAWFRAIHLLVKNPETSISQLGEATGIPRQGTLRRMATEIRFAIQSSDSTGKLAGLDVLFRDPEQLIERDREIESPTSASSIK